MMGIGPSELKALTWWEYQGMLWNWNERHKVAGEQEPVEAPPAEFVARRQAKLERMGMRVLH